MTVPHFSGITFSDPRELLFIGLMIAALSVGVGILLAPLLGAVFGRKFFNLYNPNRRFHRPQPMYSIPAAQRARGSYEEALHGYEKIASEYPGELLPYVEMINIAIVDLHDEKRAGNYLKKGLAKARNADDKKMLKGLYEAIVSRLQHEPDWLIKERARMLIPPDYRKRRLEGNADQGGIAEADAFVDTRSKIPFVKRKPAAAVSRKPRSSVPRDRNGGGAQVK